MISKLIFEQITQAHQVEVEYISTKNDYLSKFDLLIFGFPTHHAALSLSMIEFVYHLTKFERQAKSFISIIYGFYPGNSLRILAKQLNDKNIKILFSEEFKAPATDGVLLFSAKPN